MTTTSNPFSNLFDISTQDPIQLAIKENFNKDNCFIYDGADKVGGFILINKPSAKTILKITFYKSEIDNKYQYEQDFTDILTQIQGVKSKFFSQVNTALVELYYSIGKSISLKVNNQGWGKRVVQKLAE